MNTFLNKALIMFRQVGLSAVARPVCLNFIFITLACMGMAFHAEAGLRQIHIRPGQVWLDQAGAPINAHGGCVIFHNGIYYWYGTHKIEGLSERTHADGGVHCYASLDLINWHDQGMVLRLDGDENQDLTHECNFDRPKVVYNEKTEQFVLFFKLYLRGHGTRVGYVGVATSESPSGPFNYRHKFLAGNSPEGTGDFAMFKDDNGALYHFTVRKPDKAFVYGKMRDDYLLPEGRYEVCEGVTNHTEAPAVIKRDGRYWMLASGSSGWRPNAARSFSSESIHGPWTNLGNPCKGINPYNGLGPELTWGGQSSFIIKVEGIDDAYIAFFDINKPEHPYESLYIWLPVAFKDDRMSIEWMNQWNLDVFSKATGYLETQFLDPPLDVRPSAFWPWVGGHITKEGIRADLEAMKASGMRGGIIFDLNMYIPEGDVAYGSQEWQDLVDYAIAIGHGMGLEIGFHNCPGWATSGGPWVSPEQSMKRMVFSETKVASPLSTPIQLPVPSFREGFYQDIAVLAIPEKVHPPVAQISFAGQNVSGLQGTGSQSPIPVSSGEPAVFTFTYEDTTMVNSWELDLVGSVDGNVQVVIEASMDGSEFTPVATFHAGGRLRARTALSHSFGPAEGRVFRVAMIPPYNRGREARLQVAGLGLLPDTRIQNHSMLSLGSTSSAFHVIPEELPLTHAIGSLAPEEIINLSGLLSHDGTLSWDLPPGTWTIIRFGFTSTGAKNRPARKDALGLEVDKMDADAVRQFFADAVLPVLERAQGRLPLIAIDSWEAGIANWTERFPEEFLSRRGYDILPFLPVLTGRFVGSPAESYSFLHDFRITITDLVAEKYYSVMQEEVHRQGARLFVEPYAGYGMDEFRSGQYADLVAGEFWLHDVEGPGCDIHRSIRITSAIVETMKEDKRLTAEAFTSRPAGASWRRSPRTLKQLADCALINGVNDFTFHSFVHQPRDDMQPGFTHGRYGTEFVRHNTWWPMAEAFNDYLARCGLMLRQGNRAADFLFLRNEGPLVDHEFPDVPPGYDYLYIAPFTLLESKVENGLVITPGGGQHPVLVLPLSWVADMTLLEKLIELKEGGVAVLGVRPVMPAGRMDLLQMEEWNKRVDRIFLSNTSPPSMNDLTRAVQSMGIIPSFAPETPGSPLECVHRHADGLDIFFVRNTAEAPVSDEVRFRASSINAQFWDPLDGSICKAPVTVQEGLLRLVPIDLPASGSVFIIFGAGEMSVAQATAASISAEIQPEEWRVTFNPHTGESFSRAFSGLPLWNESEEASVKYFSGIAVYESTIELKQVAAGTRVVIDLGIVHDLARVRVNGREAGVCWTPPDRLDITGLVKQGVNRLEIEVANTWVNRLIGDESLPPESEYDGISNDVSFRDGVLTKYPDWYRDHTKAVARQRTTFVIWQHYDQNSPLVPSGLAGPVAVRVMSVGESAH